MKKSITNLFNTLKVVGFSTVLIFGLTTLQSCSKEGCTDDTANNYDEKADEDDGTCTYDRDAFLGSYNAQEACQSGNFNYSINVVVSSTNTVTILINNFGDFNVAVSGTVSGTSLTIASQVVTIQGNAATFTGTGALNGNTLTINYVISIGGDSDSCTITAIRS